MGARVMERSLHPGCVIVDYYVQCGGVLCKMGSGGTINLDTATRPNCAEHATALNIVVNYYATRM